MKPTISTLSLAVAALGVSVSLAGCSMDAGFPEASPNQEYSTMGPIQGSNYGGHAPITGSHVYVLQPSVTTAAGTSGSPQYNAYGAQATSLLNTGTLNVNDPGIPNTWYYITTDNTGSFNISGDYTCTVGLPVYLYIYGGSPTYPSQSNVFTISSVTVTGSSAPYTVTMTTSTTENAYVGEAVTFSSATGNKFTATGITALNGTSGNIIIGGSGSTMLSTSSFSFTTSAALTAGTYSTPGGTNQATFNPTTNPGIVNLGVLGLCPSAQNFSYLNFVYVNEVSTVAAAYAFKPFTLQSGTNATYIGTSSTNVVGLQNAAITAGLLYNIQGGGSLSTTYAGEGHVANSTTPAGNGIVPQATIDTVANILASCVDSNNTATTLGANGTQGTNMSTACTTLFANATNTGIPATSTGSGVNAPGTAPVDTAQAAINIARHPGGPPYSYSSGGSAAFVSNLWNAPTGNLPFAPYLNSAAPNDFSIAINYAYGTTQTQISGPESIAIDKLGNIWATAQNGPAALYQLFEMSPSGVISNANSRANNTYNNGYVVVDINGDAWAGDASGTGAQSYIQTSNTPSAASPAVYPPPTYFYKSTTLTATYPSGPSGSSSAVANSYPSFADSTGNVYFTYTSGGNDYFLQYTGNAASPTGTETAITALAGSSPGQHAKIDAAGYAYVMTNSTPLSHSKLSNGANYPTGTWPVTTTQCANMTGPQDVAVTRTGDAIFADYGGGSNTSVYYLTAGGTCTQLPNSTLKAGITGGPFGVAIDGNDYVFITNRNTGGGTSISELDTSAGTATGTVAISPATGYAPQTAGNATILNGPLNIAIDPSGNVWTTNYSGNAIVEIVGLAAPTTEPLAAAAIPISYTQGSIGYKP